MGSEHVFYVEDCQVRSPRLLEHEMYMFIRVWLKGDFRMIFLNVR